MLTTNDTEPRASRIDKILHELEKLDDIDNVNNTDNFLTNIHAIKNVNPDVWINTVSKLLKGESVDITTLDIPVIDNVVHTIETDDETENVEVVETQGRMG